MNITDAREYLTGLEMFGSQLGLERIKDMCEDLGHPELDYKTIIVGGTNGKGSVSIILSSILLEAGFKVGTYTSPALWDNRERILVNKKKISEKDFCRILEKLKPLQEKHKATFFEVLTAAAFLHFAEQKVDYAILEVGLGGRFDATNVAEPEVSVITNIDLDHTKVLGDTVLEIANEKAGIMRKGKALVTGSDKQDVLEFLEEHAKKANCKIVKTSGKKIAPITSDLHEQEFLVNDSRLKTKMLGDFQMENATTAISVAELFGIDREKIASGIEKAFWPGRFEVIQENPVVILSAAHNPAAISELCKSLDHIGKKKVFVFGASADKDIKSMLKEVSKHASEVILTSYSKERSAKPEDIEKYVDCKHQIKLPLNSAVDFAIEKAGDSIVVVTGSIFMAGEARQRWKKEVSFETPK
ncbi:bifunctional folylpolyglutamate synthase/dihydrofolate synthase [Candidatus Undinarchaeota archaeon]